jgi:hypothetical protein
MVGSLPGLGRMRRRYAALGFEGLVFRGLKSTATMGDPYGVGVGVVLDAAVGSGGGELVWWFGRAGTPLLSWVSEP